MEKLHFAYGFLTIFLFAAAVSSQTSASSLQNYLETGKTIVVARCLSVGPVDILLRSRVQIEILQVVKGKEKPRKITILTQYGMSVGELYLLRTENDPRTDSDYFEVTTIDSVVPIWQGEDLALLKTLPPRIVVLRTMNLRVDTLESQVRRLTFELTALKKARSE